MMVTSSERVLPRLVLPGMVSLGLLSTSACDTSQSAPPAPSAGRAEAVLAQGAAPGKGGPPELPPSERKSTSKSPAAPAGALTCRPVAGAKIPDVAVDVVRADSGEHASRFLIGDRPVLINIWAAWCEPCKAEIPLLLRFQKELSLEGRAVDVAFVSLDDDARQLERFLQQPGGLAETFFLEEGKPRQEFLKALGQAEAPRLPLQVLAAASGDVRCVIDGAVEEADLPALRQRLLSL